MKTPPSTIDPTDPSPTSSPTPSPAAKKGSRTAPKRKRAYRKSSAKWASTPKQSTSNTSKIPQGPSGLSLLQISTARDITLLLKLMEISTIQQRLTMLDAIDILLGTVLERLGSATPTSSVTPKPSETPSLKDWGNVVNNQPFEVKDITWTDYLEKLKAKAAKNIK